MKFRKPILAGLVAAALVLLPTAAASADTGTPQPAPQTTTEYRPMVAKGYDAQVAAANGFQIVTNADGTQSSVPVTAAAKAQLQQAAERRAQLQSSTVSPQGVGNCGESWASGSKIANDTVAFSTGFQVFLAATHHTWTVYATGLITANSWTTSGAGPATGNKSWTGAIPSVVGPGVGGVPWGSASASVVLVDGTVCYSDGPTFTFG